MPEHTGRVHGVSSSKGWKEAFGKENEGLWKKKKRSSVDLDRFKQEIMAEIIGALREVGIDVEAALRKSQGKSSCASKEVEQQLAAPAGEPSPPPPVNLACRTLRIAWVLVMISWTHSTG